MLLLLNFVIPNNLFAINHFNIVPVVAEVLLPEIHVYSI